MKKTFAISYKLRYAETSDWGIEYLKAISKEHALKSFARIRKIPTRKFNRVSEWRWEEGVWLAEFRHIKQIKEMPCPHCSGSGIIKI